VQGEAPEALTTPDDFSRAVFYKKMDAVFSRAANIYV
jgi:hypothetical protein